MCTGYATIETDNAVKVVPKAEAAKNHTQVRIGADPASIPKTDVIVRADHPAEVRRCGGDQRDR